MPRGRRPEQLARISPRAVAAARALDDLRRDLLISS
jgi:hypothetical protein